MELPLQKSDDWIIFAAFENILSLASMTFRVIAYICFSTRDLSELQAAIPEQSGDQFLGCLFT